MFREGEEFPALSKHNVFPFQPMPRQPVVPVPAVVLFAQLIPSLLKFTCCEPVAFDATQNTVPFQAMPLQDPVLAMVL